MDCSPPGSSVHRDSPGKNTGVGHHALLQGIFPTQRSNPGLPHCREILYCLSHQGSLTCIYSDTVHGYIAVFSILSQGLSVTEPVPCSITMDVQCVWLSKSLLYPSFWKLFIIPQKEAHLEFWVRLSWIYRLIMNSIRSLQSHPK